ncbi:hypothetical protein C2845_PM02G16370 [Panicum miliaceum]|uniref:Transposase (putative) gypsy type domain-containing protein n=1 Tax=Panicum miliaceum TaxID=4540 RepID=A0A3L6SG50_PANMI|nr:hypothetical protein C2845_PM02G16370 [Panicum miliaceum]
MRVKRLVTSRMGNKKTATKGDKRKKEEEAKTANSNWTYRDWPSPPTTSFLLYFYGLQLHHLNPNSIAHMRFSFVISGQIDGHCCHLRAYSIRQTTRRFADCHSQIESLGEEGLILLVD